MATRHEVSCIVKSNTNIYYQGITHIGGKNHDGTRWKLSEADAIQGMRSGQWEFYVNRGGRSVDVYIDKYNGREFLRTRADGITENNLLSLPLCP